MYPIVKPHQSIYKVLYHELQQYIQVLGHKGVVVVPIQVPLL
jgi:hypothetical protein